jgi:hypothetical protein
MVFLRSSAICNQCRLRLFQVTASLLPLFDLRRQFNATADMMTATPKTQASAAYLHSSSQCGIATPRFQQSSFAPSWRGRHPQPWLSEHYNNHLLKCLVAWRCTLRNQPPSDNGGMQSARTTSSTGGRRQGRWRPVSYTHGRQMKDTLVPKEPKADLTRCR